MMSDQFYCTRVGGIEINGLLEILEGTAEKGPWYNAWEFSDSQIDDWLKRDWIKFRDGD
jgi:hypothetical protein